MNITKFMSLKKGDWVIYTRKTGSSVGTMKTGQEYQLQDDPKTYEKNYGEVLLAAPPHGFRYVTNTQIELVEPED